jgi:hypothetical protein
MGLKVLVPLAALAVLGQAAHAGDGWAYEGCVEVDPSIFPISYPYPDGYTPATCQVDCAAYKYAALFHG